MVHDQLVHRGLIIEVYKDFKGDIHIENNTIESIYVDYSKYSTSQGGYTYCDDLFTDSKANGEDSSNTLDI